jgi:hypothetical protein
MKTIKHYSYEEAVAKIENDQELKALYNKLKPEFEEHGPNFDYATEYVDCVVGEDYDEETDVETLTIVVCAFGNDPDFDDYKAEVEVPTIEQAVCIIKDIEDAKGDIK